MPLTTLERIINLKESSSLIVIEDSTKQSCARLLKAFAASSIGPDRRLVVVSVEQAYWKWKRILNLESLTIIDVYSSCFSWLDPPVAAPVRSANIKNLVSVIETELQTAQNGRITVLFDSINPFLLRYSLATVARLVKSLSALGSDNVRIILPFHGDVPVLDASGNSLIPPIGSVLANAATTYVTVRHGKDFGIIFGRDGGAVDVFETVDAHNPAGGICEVLHKKKSGKVLREAVAYKVSATDSDLLTFHTVDDLRSVNDSQPSPPSNPAERTPDPTANLSFNLRLTDEQKVARAEVVLPYMKAQTAEGPSETAIYYEPEDDDYDDEDPDADLDI
ncbi:uncharacterized protein SPPG_07306 [Spizellomyces punctatus DAOM BR117]|uniref:Elongator complex protein 5 n=1 Tax=Spizellomyces punctatus (strain DAOM BR117) TaxID=645134 RepID=A0A0L0H8W2_SPIPD|nr:uncharacterized protein SPPG_07306 [Spizellomyces punctatus DAOM BR117]KNC97379.1 hypothetical protein SPPG_07306 [Spizellomyces punctatus DAOM BR117]|eukprot:XP_016605419.1 hypothetical protein SPPG_07306 [Spizellomyces punctatus DAOM BR117]